MDTCEGHGRLLSMTSYIANLPEAANTDAIKHHNRNPSKG